MGNYRMLETFRKSHFKTKNGDVIREIFFISFKASSHKIVKQSQTIGDGSGKLNLVQLSRSTQTVAGSLRSLRVYVNKIGDCLPILCELAFTRSVIVLIDIYS